MICASVNFGDSLESLLVFLAVVIISAVTNWLKRKNQPPESEPWGDEGPGTPPIPGEPKREVPRSPVPRGLADLEEELRRMLGEEPTTPPPPRTPPVIRPAAVPPTSKNALPAPPAAKQAQPRKPARKTVAQASPVPTPPASEPVSAPLAHLSQSGQAYARASHLHEHVSERLRQVDARTDRPVPSRALERKTLLSPEAAQVRKALRSRTSAREAFLASLVFGPPKSLER